MPRKGYGAELAVIPVPPELQAFLQALVRIVDDIDKRLDAGGL